MNLKSIVKKNKFLYSFVKNKRDKYREKKLLDTKYQFINRKKDYNKVCIILAGYKPFLFEEVLGRIFKFIPNDIDVCIVSSGMYSEKLKEIADENNCSYLSCKKNCVTIAQNLAISLFDRAEYIYKLDEDIFITENYFQKLMDTYIEVEKNGIYDVGFVAPLIPINGYGHYRILEKLNLLEFYKEKFERPIYAAGPTRMIENSPEVAKFMWGENNVIPGIDELNDRFGRDEFGYSACPIRFSIGAILFKRILWTNMGMFSVIKNSPCMGLDEEQICSFCINNSKAIIVSDNTVVGHLSFGRQNKEMKDYYLSQLKHKEK